MTTESTTTVREADPDNRGDAPERAPGVVLVFANGRPRARTFRWQGSDLKLGRVNLAEDEVVDKVISKEHLNFHFDGAGWVVTDLQSRNGTFVRGEPVAGSRALPSGTLVRAGGALLLPVSDVLPYERDGLGLRGDIVAGPLFRKTLDGIARAGGNEQIKAILITGESGSGKEIAALAFHNRAGERKAPFVALNCASIPKDLAERILFGSRRGAFSDATDAPGQIQAAHEGTLFLDEIAELPMDIQSKLLRVLETREVLRLGATKPEKVDVRVCCATWQDLRRDVAEGRFRQDLYYRIGRPQFLLPPLRERADEIPWHVHQVLQSAKLHDQVRVSASFIEAVAARPWPGNVRELRAEVLRAATEKEPLDGVQTLSADDLDPLAGTPIVRGVEPTRAAGFPDDEIARALRAELGNVLAAARRLQVHRNIVRRWCERHRVDPKHFRGGGTPSA